MRPIALYGPGNSPVTYPNINVPAGIIIVRPLSEYTLRSTVARTGKGLPFSYTSASARTSETIVAGIGLNWRRTNVRSYGCDETTAVLIPDVPYVTSVFGLNVDVPRLSQPSAPKRAAPPDLSLPGLAGARTIGVIAGALDSFGISPTMIAPYPM